MDIIAEIPGAVELSNWFGGFPSFHDAKADFQVSGNGTGWLKIYGFQITRRTDEKGFLVAEKQFTATFFFEEVQSVSVTDFLPGMAILGRLEIRKSNDCFELDFRDTSYGWSGLVVCRSLRLSWEPGHHAI